MNPNPRILRSAVIGGLAIICTVAASIAHGQVVDVANRAPDPVSGAPLIRLTGFTPHADVEVSFIRTPPDGVPPSFRATARYRVGSDGTVDLASAPLRGDWKTPFPEAPFWSMQPDARAPVPVKGVVLIQAESNGKHAQAEYRLPESRRTTVEPVKIFPGAFLERPTNASGPLPLIIVLGGSEGDDLTAREIAPLLASEGYAVLGFPYRSPDRGHGQAIPGLPAVFSEIPVDRLERVREWALEDTRVDPERIGIWGISKGAEFAIIAAANYPWLDAVAAIVPSDVVWEGFGSGAVERTGTSSFSLKGKPIPFVPYGAPGRFRNSKESGRWQHPREAAAARIPIERYEGLLLVAGGEADQSWDSAGMSQAIAERRAEAGRHTVSLIFLDAGHGFTGGLLDPAEPDRGGTVEGNGVARKAVWAATVDLFRTAWPR
jgi:dienelactone hydrolase